MYRWVDHTAELELRIEAPTERDVFVDALSAFAELVRDDDEEGAARHDVVLEAADSAALLAAWLEELVFLAETEDFVPERVSALELAGGRLAARLEGRRGSPPHLVKAVTYHGLELRPANGGWRARVVLDV